MKFLMKLRKTVMFIIKFMIIAAMALGFMNIWYRFYGDFLYSWGSNLLVMVSYLLILILFSELYGAFKVGVNRLHEVAYSLCLAAVFTNIIMYFELCLIARELIDLLPYVWGFAYQILVAVVGTTCANSIYFRLYPARRMLAIFADDEEGTAIIRKVSKIPDRFNIERGVSVNRKSVEEIKEIIDGFEAVLLCDIEKDKKSELLRYCYAKSKRTYVLPSSADVIIRNSDQIQIFDTPIMMCRNRGLRLEQELVKRAFDIFVAVVGIVITSPIMLVVALAIKLYDKGPVFFKQNRVTKDGKIFNVLKFRSMIVDADKDGAKKAENNDDRITPVGKIIRPFRIDELPQFFNILFGDMSLVGPRPERVENVYEYTQKYPDFNLRHRVKGGLTGYAQIYGKYNTSPEDKLKMDLIYIEQYSIFLDFKLILMTIKILFMKESTEGFDAKANAHLKAPDRKEETEK
ncbi:MAG: sugar transferase [Acutalibacteraceae bacterium]|nr:sugar transferase [Acutalibacteraceae bacterium]